ARQRVKLRLPPGLRGLPLRLQPLLLLQPVQRGIERTLVHLNHGLRNLLQPLRDAVAVRRFQRENLQDQHVERTLRDRKTGWGHTRLDDRSKIKVSSPRHKMWFVLRSEAAFSVAPIYRRREVRYRFRAFADFSR